jgi:hypothetical protein
MADSPNHSAPSDFCLLLRAHAEARWLSHEVVPVLRQLEQDSTLCEEQLGPALAYLEVLWIEACGRAAETEATCNELRPRVSGDGHSLHGRAQRYHTAVRGLRDTIARRVAELIAAPGDASARWSIPDRQAST